MARLVLIERNGPASEENDTEVSNLNFGSTDQADLSPTDYPLQPVEDGSSYEKWLRLRSEGLEASFGSQIDNVKIWISHKSKNYKTDERVVSNLTHVPHKYESASYPTNGPESSRSEVAIRDVPEKEPIQGNIGIGGNLLNAITTDGAYTDWIVLQLHLSDKTEPGSLSDKVFTIQWDET